VEADVLVTDCAPGGAELAALAAELEAAAPALLRAALAASAGELELPPALRVVREHARTAELSIALCSDEYIQEARRLGAPSSRLADPPCS
jgi:hypothetical protein